MSKLRYKMKNQINPGTMIKWLENLEKVERDQVMIKMA